MGHSASSGPQFGMSFGLDHIYSRQTSTKDDQYTTDVSWVDEPGEVCAMQVGQTLTSASSISFCVAER
jgi:hypothetical protein